MVLCSLDKRIWRHRQPLLLIYFRPSSGVHNWVVVENLEGLDATVDEHRLQHQRVSIRRRLSESHRLIREMRLVSREARQRGEVAEHDVSVRVQGMGDTIGILPINAIRSPTTTMNIREFLVTHAGREHGQTLSILHPWYEPAHYVLLRPAGDEGWSPGMRSESGDTRITLSRYCTQETLRSCYLQSCGRLFSEWLCDSASRLLDERLYFIRNNRRLLIPYSELRRAVGGRGRGNGRRGRGRRGRGSTRRRVTTDRTRDAGVQPGRTILPATFTTSPRWYRARLEDALAVAARLGSPTFFITLTANPRWPEIINELLPGQSASDRPDVVLRVFRARVLQVRRHLTRIFCAYGERYSLVVYEFQHRGKSTACRAGMAHSKGGQNSVPNIVSVNCRR